jgi:hypothetical protein
MVKKRPKNHLEMIVRGASREVVGTYMRKVLTGMIGSSMFETAILTSGYSLSLEKV